MIKVGILGATGYTGAELLRFLVKHPEVKILWLTSEKFSGKRISDVFPQFRGFVDLECTKVAHLEELDTVDIAFSCLPNGISMHFVKKLIDSGIRVVDLSADFRLRDEKLYESTYKVKHPYKELLREAVYGLPEIHRESIKEARLVTNPGCFSTTLILGIAPLLSEGLINGEFLIVDSKCGVSGKGRAPLSTNLFCEVKESVSVHGLEGHNQKYEMEKEIIDITGYYIPVTFISHTIPINRGILTTVYVPLKTEKKYEHIRDLYKAYYRERPFIRIYESGKLPELKSVSFSNFCDIGFGLHDNVFVCVVAIDNLGKGASGQAVQNMNIMFDFPENEALRYPGIYP